MKINNFEIIAGVRPKDQVDKWTPQDTYIIKVGSLLYVFRNGLFLSPHYHLDGLGRFMPTVQLIGSGPIPSEVTDKIEQDVTKNKDELDKLEILYKENLESILEINPRFPHYFNDIK